MVWIIGLTYLLWWEHLPSFGRYAYVEMTRSLVITALVITALLSCRLSTGAKYTPFIVISTQCGASRPVYGGVYTVKRHGEGYLHPTWMAA
jgi:hypothetical protein